MPKWCGPWWHVSDWTVTDRSLLSIPPVPSSSDSPLVKWGRQCPPLRLRWGLQELMHMKELESGLTPRKWWMMVNISYEWIANSCSLFTNICLQHLTYQISIRPWESLKICGQEWKWANHTFWGRRKPLGGVASAANANPGQRPRCRKGRVTAQSFSEPPGQVLCWGGSDAVCAAIGRGQLGEFRYLYLPLMLLLAPNCCQLVGCRILPARHLLVFI